MWHLFNDKRLGYGVRRPAILGHGSSVALRAAIALIFASGFSASAQAQDRMSVTIAGDSHQVTAVRGTVVEWGIEQQRFFAGVENGIALEALGRF